MSIIKDRGGYRRVNLESVQPARHTDGSTRVRRNWLPGTLVGLLFALLLVLLVQYTGYLKHSSFPQVWQTGGATLIIFIVFVLAASYIKKFQPGMRHSRGALFTFGLFVFFILFIAKGFELLDWPLFLIPVSFISIILALVYGQLFSIQVTAAICLFVSIKSVPGGMAFDENSFKLLVVLMAGGVVAIFGVSHIENRTRLILVGILVGLTHALTILGLSMVFDDYAGIFMLKEGVVGTIAGTLGMDMLMGFINGVGVGFLFTGFLPFIEKLLGITTDISLIELSDQNQSILKQFFLKAPGSYHHSLIVGNLAEAASVSIGANPFLARVGSYFHDIGKISKPEYFTENESAKGSKHSRLTPAMSTLIIIAHVKDGVEIGEEELGLPPVVVDIIRTHHGNGLVEYFYAQAKKDAEADSTAGEVDEASFRYPGPRPPFKEAGIVLLADAIEAVSRTLEDPTPSRIEAFVEETITKRLMDGQLDDSELTLTDLKKIKAAFARVLLGTFHSRIKYPGQT